MDIYEIRKTNLVRLIGTQRKGMCAERWGMSPAHLSQILSDKTPKNLGDDVARRIEELQGLPRGWLDALQPDEYEQELNNRLNAALAMNSTDNEAFEAMFGCSRSEALSWRNFGFIGNPKAIESIEQMPAIPKHHGNGNVAATLQPHREAKEYPLISWVAAGCWEESCDNFNPGDADEWLKSDANAGAHGYWLEVKGPSMLPTFSPGMRILVKPENFDLTSGKYYVAKLLDTGETTFKQYLRDGGSSYLQPLNQAFPVIPVTENVAIIGMVIDAKLPASLF